MATMNMNFYSIRASRVPFPVKYIGYFDLCVAHVNQYLNCNRRLLMIVASIDSEAHLPIREFSSNDIFHKSNVVNVFYRKKEF